MTLELLKAVTGMNSFFEFYDFLVKSNKENAEVVKFDLSNIGGESLIVNVSEIKSKALSEIYDVLPDFNEKQKIMHKAWSQDLTLLNDFFNKLPNK